MIGASRDSVKRQQNFIEKRELTTDIISDVDSELCDHFKVIGEKKAFGKISIGLMRTTIVLDEDLNEIKRYDSVKVKNHAQTVLEDLKELK